MGRVRENGVLVGPGKKPAGGDGTHRVSRCMQGITMRWHQGESLTKSCYNLVGVAGIPKGGLHAGPKPCTDLTLISIGLAVCGHGKQKKMGRAPSIGVMQCKKVS